MNALQHKKTGYEIGVIKYTLNNFEFKFLSLNY